MDVQEILGYVDAGLGLVTIALGWVPLSTETRQTVEAIVSTARHGLREAIERDTVLRGAADGEPGVIRDER